MASKRRREGWTAARVLTGYGDHINRVRGFIRPGALMRSGSDTADLAYQCFKLVADFQGYDDKLMRRAFTRSVVITAEEQKLVEDFTQHLDDWCDYMCWAPLDRREDSKPPKDVVTLAVAGEKLSTDPSTIRRWINQGMPHFRRGSHYSVQLSVVERWQKMKYRHQKHKKDQRRRKS